MHGMELREMKNDLDIYYWKELVTTNNPNLEIKWLFIQDANGLEPMFMIDHYKIGNPYPIRRESGKWDLVAEDGRVICEINGAIYQVTIIGDTMYWDAASGKVRVFEREVNTDNG